MNEGLLNYTSDEVNLSGIGARQRHTNVNPVSHISSSNQGIRMNNGVKHIPSAAKGQPNRARTDSQRELETFGFKGVINESEDGWGAVSNLDVFFGNMYHFYHHRGLTTIVTSGVSNIITLAFTILFSTFLFSFVRWKKLWKCRDEETCAPYAQDYVRNPFDHTTFLDAMVFIWFVLFTMYWAWVVVLFVGSIRDASDMAILFRDKLDISNKDLQTIEWHEVVSRLEALQKSGKYTIAITGGSFTARDIACRIMRKENYLIAMINKGVIPLQLPLPKWPPPPLQKFIDGFMLDASNSAERDGYYALPNINENSAINVNSHQKNQKYDVETQNSIAGGWCRLSKRSYFTGLLEWVLNVCLLTHIHDESFTVNPEFIRDSASLKRRFFTMGCVYIALMPFVLVFMIVHFFLKNAQEWHSKKNYLGPRQWDHLATWHFREFNELPHVFERRITLSYEHAGKYTRRFHSPVLAVVARAVSFISGSFIGVLLFLTVIDDDAFLFHVALNDHNLLWHLGILSAVFAVAKGFSGEPPDEAIMDADEMMGRVAEHTHYFPESWRGQCASHTVRDEFLSIFKFKAQLFAEEVLVVLLAPYLLCQSFPAHADKILAFIQEHTVNVEGLGGVCSFSLFDFKRYGDERYAAPSNGEQQQQSGNQDESSSQRKPATRTEQGKLEKSFLNFKMNHPDWECGPEGDAFMQNLCDFQEREVVSRRQQQAASLLASQLHVSEVLQSSMLRQSVQFPERFQEQPNLDGIQTFDINTETKNALNTQDLSPPNQQQRNMSRSGPRQPTAAYQQAGNHRLSASLGNAPSGRMARSSSSNSQHLARAFPSIPENMNSSNPDMATNTEALSETEVNIFPQGSNQDTLEAGLTNSTGGGPDSNAFSSTGSGSLSSPDRIIRINSSASPPLDTFMDPLSPQSGGIRQKGTSLGQRANRQGSQYSSSSSSSPTRLHSMSEEHGMRFGDSEQGLSSGLGSGGVGHSQFNSINLAQSDLALSSVLASLNGLNGNSILARSISGANSMYSRGGGLNEPRSVEAMIQSALREESQSMLLRDVLHRRAASSGTSMGQLLDSNVEASFYWLDKYREESGNKLRNSLSQNQQDRNGSGQGGGGGGSSFMSSGGLNNMGLRGTTRAATYSPPQSRPYQNNGASNPVASTAPPTAPPAAATAASNNFMASGSSNDNSQVSSSSGSKNSVGFCLRCGQPGHLSDNCPRSQAVVDSSSFMSDITDHEDQRASLEFMGNHHSQGQIEDEEQVAPVTDVGLEEEKSSPVVTSPPLFNRPPGVLGSVSEFDDGEASV